MLTDSLKECQKSKLLGGSGAYSPRNFNSQKSSESFRQVVYCLPHLTDFNLEIFLVKLKLYNFIIIERSDQFPCLQLLSIIIILIILLLLIFVCRDGQLYVVILRNQQRSASPGPAGAEIVLYQLQRYVDLYLNALIDFDLPITIGSLHELITWSTLSKHENSSLLKNVVSASWKSIY